ncbi:MAG: T9SS type A sorting domain-containing protein, partial [Bacteroidales bacterium]|nr:T9SS type A sorting domain-containing protein [Bacteroidales bacterium]
PYTYSVNGWKNGDEANASSLLTVVLKRDAGEAVGLYDIIIDQWAETSGNYTLKFTPNIKFEIKPATLTITPDAGQSKIYNDPDPLPYTYSVNGWKNGDEAKVPSLLINELSRDPGEAVGWYDITIGLLEETSKNYTLIFTPLGRQFEIKPRPVTLIVNLDNAGYLLHGKTFTLRNAVGAIIDTGVGANDTVIFSNVANSGTYRIFDGADDTGFSIPVIVENDVTATLNYYTVSVAVNPASAATPSGGGVFLAGKTASVDFALAPTVALNAFKEWTSDKTGTALTFTPNKTTQAVTFAIPADVSAPFTVTALFFTADLILTPPAQGIRGNTTGNIAADVTTGGYTATPAYSSLLWFREPVNSAASLIPDSVTFNSLYAAADAANKGEINPFNGNANIAADKNARYWVMTTVTVAAPQTFIRSVEIRNIFTSYPVNVRHIVPPNDILQNYSLITNTTGILPGIPYDLEGMAVVNALPNGLNYDVVHIAGLPAYTGAYSWLAPAETANNTPHDFTLNATFLTNTACDVYPSGGSTDRHYYSVVYTRDNTQWKAIRATIVDRKGVPLPGLTTVDIDVPTDTGDPWTSSSFKANNGHLVPPDDVTTGKNYYPRGWYISPGRHSIVDADDKVPATGTNPALWFAQPRFDDFDAVLHLDPAGTGAPYPLTNSDTLFIVYSSDDVTRVFENYYEYDAVTGTTSRSLKPTTPVYVPVGDKYTHTTKESTMPGKVIAGYSITHHDGSTIQPFTEVDVSALGPFDPQFEALTVMVDVIADMSINYYYTDVFPGTGIPAHEVVTVVERWYRFTNQGTQNLKPLKPFVMRANAATDGTKVYFAIDGDKSLAPRSVNNLVEPGGTIDFGSTDAYYKIVTVGPPDSTWIFNSGLDENTLTLSAAMAGTDVYLTGFGYDYASDGETPDVNQYIEEDYLLYPDADLLPGVDNFVKMPLLKSQAYSKLAPVFTGYVAIGWYWNASDPTATWDGLADFDRITPATGNTATASLPAGRPDNAVVISFIYAPAIGDIDGDGLTNEEEINLGTDLFNPDSEYTDVTNAIPNGTETRWLVDCGKDRVEITVHPIDPGTTVSYKGVAGFTFTVSDIRPGITKVEYTLTAANGKQMVHSIELEKWFEFDDIVYAGWNSALAVNNNPQTNKIGGVGYRFIENSYRWYLNGMETGETTQFYAVPNGANLNENDKYYVTMLTVEELPMRTCEGSPHWSTQQRPSLKAYPNPSARGQNIRIVVEGNADLDAGKPVDAWLMSVTGRLVKYIRLESPETVVNPDDLPAGIYIIKVNNEYAKIVIEN